MAGGVAAAITDQDVRALAAKLKGLHALLTPGEQALLHFVLRRAAHEPAAGEEALWAVSFNPFPYLDALVREALVSAPPDVAAVPPRAGTPLTPSGGG